MLGDKEPNSRLQNCSGGEGDKSDIQFTIAKVHHRYGTCYIQEFSVYTLSTLRMGVMLLHNVWLAGVKNASLQESMRVSTKYAGSM